MNIPNFYCTFLPSLDNQSKINPATQTQQIWAPLQTKKPNPSISTTTKNANPGSPKPISSDHDNHNPDQSDQSTRLSYLPSSRWSHHRNNAIEQRCRDTPSPIFDATTAKDTPPSSYSLVSSNSITLFHVLTSEARSTSSLLFQFFCIRASCS